MRRIRLVGSLIIGALAVPAQAEIFAGTAEVRDGDSLVIDGRQIRLFGIDAPELAQTCQTDGKEWPCGEEAKLNLKSLVEGKRVECSSDAVDIHGRHLSVCNTLGSSLNATMVEYGWAVAYREYSSDYVAIETRAKADRAGIWSSTFVTPSEFRHGPEIAAENREQRLTAQRRPQAQQAKSYGCTIKGNRNRKGQWIYHLPGMPYYDVTRPEEIFCSEAEARAAGYRRAIVR
ncbi:thermonuclease family protein [Altererythrobacter sediminis]|uniref:Thermonuclease family protein n=2 Tax=Allopontixanthobacter sediminis TaxID=1689985 RepID=A0A845AZC5_9SPHN|nr:thermonuclease family protein [Allopontixanthobacter sediminis]